MRPPPAKPFAVIFLSALGIFILWGIVGAVLETRITNPEDQRAIGRIALPVAFGLFLLMGFSAVPVFVRLFFKMFFGMQKAAGGAEQPLMQRLQAKQDTIAAVLVYVIWAIYALGTLIAAPFALRDMMSGL
ncbi:MAG TPA: hypothetical protein VLJ37_12240 [bacterium]|nr:hypothetical protein [bacterium]